METLCKKIVAHIHAGGRIKDIAGHFCVSASLVYKVRNKYNVTKDFTDHPQTGRPHTVHSKANNIAVKARVEISPSNNIHKIARELNMDNQQLVPEFQTWNQQFVMWGGQSIWPWP